ncbi:MAG: hypothetical protein EPN73_22385 [Paraburkholderia sp.]|uniref:Uncharacterized protein n=1 Tax=Paraburkholderia terricola TaxID=169427 RepID=A0A1M6J142_9BURK|nr:MULTISPECIES: hypothetical protein [Paraburkholderia]TAL93128.1 MAG: hypothetical protein EPN73_22385 [Paraburkholderia sp.]SDN48992.1 hypothetical protein SAMN05192547_100128 [Paraburkholderia sediminicola]SHJ40433.1 hypothetical protein SAMN05192548_1001327 [Paraburkholderia terricola]
MNANGKSLTIVNGASAAAFHVRSVLVAFAVLAIVTIGVLASLWAASFFLYASLRMNPLHAGLWGWPDVLLAWRHGQMPNAGRRLAGAALLGVLAAVGGPATGLYTLWESTGRRRLYGSARFASEAEIRAAGLL